MRHLLQVLEIQEEECRASIESARAELKGLEQALARSVERGRVGRRLVAASAATGDITDRIAGVEEIHLAKRIATALAQRIGESEIVVNTRQGEFLAKRIERRQTETLIEEAEALESVKAKRRAQRSLDDWFLSRRGTSGTARDDEMPENAHGTTNYASQPSDKS
jgi:hypothetical protein